MNIKFEKMILGLLLILSIYPIIGTARPGLLVNASPQEITAPSDRTIDYVITITNLDKNETLDNGDGTYTFIHYIQKIKYIDVNEFIRCSGCTYKFIPDINESFVYNGTDVTTLLRVYIPPGKAIGEIIDHHIDVKTQEDVCFDDSCSVFIQFYDSSLDPNSEGYYTDIGYTLIKTIISSTTPAPIPEFPTVAIPIISVLGLVFLMRRRK